MHGQAKGAPVARRRAAVAAACSALVVVGGLLISAPAHADGISGAACTTPTTLVDTTGTGTGLIGLTGSGSGSGLTVAVDCATTVTVGGGATTPTPTTTTSTPTDSTPTPTPTTASTAATSSTTDDATTDVADAASAAAALSTVTDATTAPVTDAASTVSTAGAAPSGRLTSLTVLRSSNTVYPVRDGFRDSVRFAVNAVDASGAFVPVVGSAVLTKAGKTVRTWHIDGSTTAITWNGRVKNAIRAGLYTLTVTAWSPDGTTGSARTMVRVLTRHLTTHTMVVRSNVGAKSVSADMPRSLLKAYRTGPITCRIVTVAKVTGPAKLVFSSPGVSRSVPLKDGTRTTKALPVPQGFSHVTITHAWKKGDAHLTSLKAIWTYSLLTK